jgi:hypothetical protein
MFPPVVQERFPASIDAGLNANDAGLTKSDAELLVADPAELLTTTE